MNGKFISILMLIILEFQDQVNLVFHDVLVVLGIFSLTYSFMPFNMEINQAFIAARFTIKKRGKYQLFMQGLGEIALDWTSPSESCVQGYVQSLNGQRKTINIPWN